MRAVQISLPFLISAITTLNLNQPFSDRLNPCEAKVGTGHKRSLRGSFLKWMTALGGIEAVGGGNSGKKG